MVSNECHRGIVNLSESILNNSRRRNRHDNDEEVDRLKLTLSLERTLNLLLTNLEALPPTRKQSHVLGRIQDRKAVHTSLIPFTY